MNYLLLVLATVTSAANSLLWKRTSAETKDDRVLHMKSAVIFAVSAFVVLLYALATRDLLHVSSFTLLLSIAFALSKTVQQAALLFAMRIGATSITQLIFALGILLPIFYGAIALGEEISLMQYIGMALFFLALCFIVNPRADKGFRLVWLLLCLLAATSSGVNAVLQKMHQASNFSDELKSFVVLSLALSALFSLGLSALEALRQAHKKKRAHAVAVASDAEGSAPDTAPLDGVSMTVKVDEKADKKASLYVMLLFLLACGLCVGLQNLLSFMLAGRLPAVIHFPIYNIGSIVLVGFGGRLFYGERLSRSQLIGFAIGCAAIIFIGLF